MSGKRYYPNNWEAFKDAPDEMFEPHTYEEVMDWKVAGWELPGSVACIIRVHDKQSGKVKEHVYQREHAAQDKVHKLMKTPHIEFTVCDHESIHHLIMGPFEDELNDD
jgi:hypothetical protein